MDIPINITKLNLFKWDKLPLILQVEVAECGIACIAMIAGYHGHHLNLHEMRRKVSVSQSGTNLEFLSQLADNLGMSGRPLRLELEDLKSLKTPTLLHWGLNHFVVLKKVHWKSITIHDPSKGKRTLTFEEASKYFTGIAMELTPTTDFIKKEEKEKVKLWDLWSKMTGFIPTMIQITVITIVLQFFALVSPLVNQLVIDEAITKGDISFLNIVILGFILLLVIQTGVEVLRRYVTMYFSTILNFQMRSNMLRHLMRLSAEFFEKRHVGDILSRMSSLKSVQNLFANAFITVLLDGIMASITLGVMFLYSPLLTGAVILIVLLSLIVRLATFPYVLRLKEEQILKNADLQTILLETIRGARAIKIFGRENERHGLWQNTFADSMNIGLRLQRFTIWSGASRKLVFGTLGLGIYYLGAKLVINQELTLGMFFAFQAYRGQFTGRVNSVIDLYFSFRTVGLHLERLTDVVYAEQEIGINDSTSSPKSITGLIEVKNLKFRYGDNEPWILEDVSFTIHPNDRVALMGPSGRGKTTLLKLLIGLHTPVEGEILYDGIPLSSMGIRSIRHQIGVVMQDDRLLSGSLYENISFFDPEVNIEKVDECARLAHVHEDILKMPMGFESLIGDMGSILSGGQKQRILLARALYNDPTILFLDEGTANLDVVTERNVIAELSKLTATQVIVAHRKAAIKDCNRIFKIDAKTVTEINTK